MGSPEYFPAGGAWTGSAAALGATAPGRVDAVITDGDGAGASAVGCEFETPAAASDTTCLAASAICWSCGGCGFDGVGIASAAVDCVRPAGKTITGAGTGAGCDLAVISGEGCGTTTFVVVTSAAGGCGEDFTAPPDAPFELLFVNSTVMPESEVVML